MQPPFGAFLDSKTALIDFHVEFLPGLDKRKTALEFSSEKKMTARHPFLTLK
jgi:hypothetical protein